MKDKTKKILSYLGVALLSSIFSVGVLIGVSSCHANTIKEEKPIQTQALMPRLSYSDSEDGFSISQSELNEYRFINLYEYIYENDWSWTAGSATSYTNLGITYEGDYYYWISNYNDIVTFGDNDSPRKFIYLNNNGVFTGYGESGFFRDGLKFIYPNATDITRPMLDNAVNGYISQDIEAKNYNEMGEFTFNVNINANACYPNASLTNFFVTDANSTADTLNKYFYQNWFKSGGQMFDSMCFVYKKVSQGLRYEGPGSSITPYAIYTITDATNKYYFSELKYMNTYTGDSVVVNTRDSYIDDSGEVLKSTTSWTSNNYRVIYLNIVDDTLNAYLNRVNTETYYSTPYIEDNSVDVGLSSVFTLLGMAFSSWATIFAIQVVPGITIGLLMFLPLIAGIIVLIFWIVKR